MLLGIYDERSSRERKPFLSVAISNLIDPYERMSELSILTDASHMK